MSSQPAPSRFELGLWAVRGAGFGLGLLGIAIVAGAGREAGDVLVLLLVTLLLAAAVEPVVNALRDRTGRSRVQIILLLYVLLAAVATLLVILLVPAMADQFVMLGERLPGLIEDGRAWVAALQPAIVGTVLERVIDAVDSTLMRTGVISPEPETLLEVGLSVADAVLAVLSVLTLTFFWLISRAMIQRFALAMVALERRREIRTAWNEMEGRLGQWLRGQLTLMLVVGSASTLAYIVLGLPNALLLGIFAGVAEIVPIVGPAIGAFPALITAFVTGGPELALLVVGVYVIIQVVEGQILVPIIMRGAVGVPPFLVLASLLVGGAVAGIVGALLAVPVTAAAIVILEHAQARRRTVHLDMPEIASGEGDDKDAGRTERPRREPQVQHR
jgi:predicted PurR-regulated permease PerM